MRLLHSPPGARMASAPLTKPENVTNITGEKKNGSIKKKLKHYLPVMIVTRAFAESLSILSNTPVVASVCR